ncbi:hypothetical protein [Candidatus Poriferisodalis sp.]|uniref:hypothetical protein n=1 Tax=Candidatus Poriferisodalis sp. TaxID=3101277 RepID=UPI003B023915
MRRTAAALAGRPTRSAGRLPEGIAAAMRLQLCGVSAGSITVELRTPALVGASDALELEDASLADAAARTALEVLDGTETGYGDTAAAWHQLAKRLDIGGRNDTLTVSVPSLATPAAVLDEAARTRMAESIRQFTVHEETGERVGVLCAANFEKHSAHLRTADGDDINVKFGEEHAGSIKAALRKKARLRGHITYNEHTSAIASVELVEILDVEQLAPKLQVPDFWTTKSVHELAEEQHVSPVKNIDELRDDTISDEEATAFMDALGL